MPEAIGITPELRQKGLALFRLVQILSEAPAKYVRANPLRRVT